MQVDAVRRGHLRVAATRGATLDAEHGAEGGFAQGAANRFADVLHALRQADGRGGLSFARGGRRRRRDQDQALGAPGRTGFIQGVQVDLHDLPTVGHTVAPGYAETVRDLVDGRQFGLSCNVVV